MRLWVRSAVRRRRFEREMQEEMAEHLRRSTERLMARGLAEGEARRQAEREFGNVPYLQEQARDARSTAWLDTLHGDVRFALRHFGRTPVTTLTMLVVLAVGMSISALLFSYVHSYATLPPPALERAEDLVRIRGSRQVEGGRMFRTFGAEELTAYTQLSDHFTEVAGWTDELVVLKVGAEETRDVGARAAFVTESYFRVLGIGAAAGRVLPASTFSDPAEAAVAVIGHAVWEELLGADPSVIGSTLHVNGRPFTVAGVAPQRFRGVSGFGEYHIWMPLAAHRLVIAEPPLAFRAAARLRPDASMSEATAAVGVVAARSTTSDVESRLLAPSSEVVPLLAANGDPMFDQDVRIMSFSVGLLALLVLLMTCTNVSALLTGLATARRQEIAVRLSLGAGRPRLIRQLLTESVLLACAAAATALGVVWIVLGAARRYLYSLPLDLSINWAIIAFTFAVALTVGVAFGLSPALHATRLALASVMRDSAANLAAVRGRLQRGLVVAQIAFTQPLIVLLVAVLIFLVTDLRRPRLTSEVADQVITVTLHHTQMSRSGAEAQQRLRLTVQDLLSETRALAGVRSAIIDWRTGPALGTYAPHPEDRVGESIAPVPLDAVHTSRGYLDLLGIPLLRGREFTDTEVMHVAHGEIPIIIGADLARRVWGAADPVGRRLEASNDSAGPRHLLVVGVVDDPLAERRRPDEPHRIYMPPDTGRTPSALFVRSRGHAQPLLSPVRVLVARRTPTGMVATVRTLADASADHERRFRIVTGSISAAGLLALLLSAIGLYAVIAFAVTQRTREIAVRMAIGGRIPQIVASFIVDGLKLSALGLAFGLPLSVLGLRMLMTVPDVPKVGLPHVTLIAALGVISVAITAAWLPARRAAAVEPAAALRSE